MAKNLVPFWGIDPTLYREEDGIHSKYIDAVELTVGKSSYTDERSSFSRFGSVNPYKLEELLVEEL